jgi:nucleotide-binding universal stress UspA family protein
VTVSDPRNPGNMDNSTALPIVVGVDGSPASLDALTHAGSIAQALTAPLRVVTTWSFPAMLASGYVQDAWTPEADAREILSDALTAVFHDDLPEQLTQVVTQGSAATTLIDESSHAQMIVVGSRGYGGFAGLLMGSVSSAVAQHAHCPVLITRPSASHN